MNATTILCILLLSLYLVLAVFWIVRSIIDTIDDRKREKRNAALEAEREAMRAEEPPEEKPAGGKQKSPVGGFVSVAAALTGGRLLHVMRPCTR